MHLTQCTASINCKWTGSSCVSCVKSGACTGSTSICDGYWCSSGNVCQNNYKWTGVRCEQADPCYTNPCPYTISQPQYWTTAACFYPNLPSTPSQSCCIVNYGVQTSDKLPIGTY